MARVWDRFALTGLWVFCDWVLYPFWGWVVQPCLSWLFGWIFDLFTAAEVEEQAAQASELLEQLDGIAVSESDSL